MNNNGFETTSKWWESLYRPREDGDSEEYQPDTIHREIWTKKILSYFPTGQRLKILDVGTGGGFIACSLASAGHKVTGVDLSDERIQSAREKSRKMGLDISFVCTDAGELPFAENTFDVVVCRNLVWTLYDPEKTMEQWIRVLKPGGMILYIDANWFYYLYDTEAAELFDPAVYSYSQTEQYKACEQSAYDMPLSREKRPEWDCKALGALGLTEVEAWDITDIARTEEEKRTYAFAPLFAVRGVKPQGVDQKEAGSTVA